MLVRRVAIVTLLCLSGCRSCQSDAARAKAERAEMEQNARKSLALLPYRMIKVTLRSKDEPNAPAHLDEAWAAVEATLALPETPKDPIELAHVAATWARLAAALISARSELLKHDEDEYPTLWAKMMPSNPPPAIYDPPLEHLGLAAIWFAGETAGKSDRMLVEAVGYELSKATPSKTWTPDLRIIAGIIRGLSFCGAKYHYAAEEELDAAILELQSADAKSFTAWHDVDPEKQLHGLRAIAFFSRAWNRLGLGRDDPAVDDLERGLTELEAAGLKSELNDWGWAVVHSQRGKYEEAGADLERLAASPNIEPAQRAELLEVAREMKQHGKGIPLFLKARGAVIVAQALLVRAGGMEQLLATLFGEEKAHQVYGPISWIERAQRAVRDAPGEAVETGKKKGLDLVRAGLDRLKGADAAVP